MCGQKKTKRITIRVDEETYKLFNKHCDDKSKLVRKWIDRFLELKKHNKTNG